MYTHEHVCQKWIHLFAASAQLVTVFRHTRYSWGNAPSLEWHAIAEEIREAARIIRQKLFKQIPVIIGESFDFLPSFLPCRRFCLPSSLRHGQRLRRQRRRLLLTELHQLSEHCAALLLVTMGRKGRGAGRCSFNRNFVRLRVSATRNPL